VEVSIQSSTCGTDDDAGPSMVSRRRDRGLVSNVKSPHFTLEDPALIATSVRSPVVVTTQS